MPIPNNYDVIAREYQTSTPHACISINNQPLSNRYGLSPRMPVTISAGTTTPFDDPAPSVLTCDCIDRDAEWLDDPEQLIGMTLTMHAVKTGKARVMWTGSITDAQPKVDQHGRTIVTLKASDPIYTLKNQQQEGPKATPPSTLTDSQLEASYGYWKYKDWHWTKPWPATGQYTDGCPSQIERRQQVADRAATLGYNTQAGSLNDDILAKMAPRKAGDSYSTWDAWRDLCRGYSKYPSQPAISFAGQWADCTTTKSLPSVQVTLTATPLTSLYGGWGPALTYLDPNEINVSYPYQVNEQGNHPTQILVTSLSERTGLSAMPTAAEIKQHGSYASLEELQTQAAIQEGQHQSTRTIPTQLVTGGDGAGSSIYMQPTSLVNGLQTYFRTIIQDYIIPAITVTGDNAIDIGMGGRPQYVVLSSHPYNIKPERIRHLFIPVKQSCTIDARGWRTTMKLWPTSITVGAEPEPPADLSFHTLESLPAGKPATNYKSLPANVTITTLAPTVGALI